MSDSSCAFCRIAERRTASHIVWEDAEHVAFLDHQPVVAGHVLLIPRRHVPTVYDLTPEAYARLFARARALAGPVAAAAGAPRTGLAVEGFGVPHAHVHLVPVWRGGDLDPCRQRPATAAELEAAATRVPAAIRAAAG
jgi:histidine triad (HIT) family protein